MAVSRQRESLADATAVQYTRNPVGLARALEKIRDVALPFHEKSHPGHGPFVLCQPAAARGGRQRQQGRESADHAPADRADSAALSNGGHSARRDRSSHARVKRHGDSVKARRILLDCPQCSREMTVVTARATPGTLDSAWISADSAAASGATNGSCFLSTPTRLRNSIQSMKVCCGIRSH